MNTQSASSTHPSTLAAVRKVMASIAAAKPAAPSPLYVVEIAGGFFNFHREPVRKIEWPRGANVVSPDSFRQILRDPAFRELAVVGGLSTVVGVTLFHASDEERKKLVCDLLGL